MIQRLVIATHNVKKGGEMLTILGRALPGLELLTLNDFPPHPEPVETATTYEENAAIKAVDAARHTGEWCLADDAGLEIDALPGELGVFSKRFAGEETPFPEKMAIILDRMKDLPLEERAARFRCLVALAGPGGTPVELFEGVCPGVIARRPSGSGGFGYDPIFFLPDLGCTMADLAPDQKHSISHRGKVLAKVISRLST